MQLSDLCVLAPSSLGMCRLFGSARIGRYGMPSFRARIEKGHIRSHTPLWDGLQRALSRHSATPGCTERQSFQIDGMTKKDQRTVAAIEAALEADALMESGDMDPTRAWVLIMSAILDLTAPASDSDTLH